TTDIIVGFCGETEEDHRETLSLMEMVRFDSAYMFAYSERPGTLAARKYPDDVPEEIKKRRLAEVMALQDQHSVERNQEEESKVHRVLIEGKSKRSDQDWCGRNSRNKMVVFPGKERELTPDIIGSKDLSPGTFVDVTVHRSTKATLMGHVVEFDVVQA
ncbi:MAG: TRAM domain-containing protein, partial [Bacteroidota bacterium]